MARKRQPRISQALDLRLGEIERQQQRDQAISTCPVAPVSPATAPVAKPLGKRGTMARTRTTISADLLKHGPTAAPALPAMDADGVQQEVLLGARQRQSLQLAPTGPTTTSHEQDRTKGSSRLRDGSALAILPISRPKLMDHDARLKLIRQPFRSQIVTTKKSWGGVNVGNAGSVPTEGHRTWQLSAADESYLRYGRSDDEGSGD